MQEISISSEKMGSSKNHPKGPITANSCGSSNGVGLSDDVLIEILTRLPLKSFFRFKCVCKAWYTLISDDYVRRRLPLTLSGVYYLSGANLNKENRYACIYDSNFVDSPLGFFPFRLNSSLIDSCNGLLLYYSSLPAKFYVCNPITKKWVALPKPTKTSRLSVLAFDPCLSPHYKVVCFTGWRTKGAELAIFSSETGNWVEHELNWGFDTDTMSATIRFFDGVLHVLAYPQQIICIDLEKMTCYQIELPEPTRNEGCLGKSGGYLNYTNNDGLELRIWMLKNDFNNCKWMLKQRISVRAVIEQYCILSTTMSLPRQFNFLAFHPELEVVYIWAPGKLLSYDLIKKIVDVVCEFGVEMERAYLIQIWLFPFSSYMSDCLSDIVQL